MAEASASSATAEKGDLEAFRREVVEFLQAHWVDAAAERDPTAFRRAATEAGYLYRSVPRQYGGSEQAPDADRSFIDYTITDLGAWLHSILES